MEIGTCGDVRRIDVRGVRTIFHAGRAATAPRGLVAGLVAPAKKVLGSGKRIGRGGGDGRGDELG